MSVNSRVIFPALSPFCSRTSLLGVSKLQTVLILLPSKVSISNSTPGLNLITWFRIVEVVAYSYSSPFFTKVTVGAALSANLCLSTSTPVNINKRVAFEILRVINEYLVMIINLRLGAVN